LNTPFFFAAMGGEVTGLGELSSKGEPFLAGGTWGTDYCF